MITANEKYCTKWTAAKMFIIKCFDPTLRIMKYCCRAKGQRCCRAPRVVPDDRFEVQNDPACSNIGFSKGALSRKDRIWREGTTKFSCSHLAVDILQCRASCCAEQPPVSMGLLVPRYRARKKGRCIGRKQNPYLNQERGVVDLHFV